MEDKLTRRSQEALSDAVQQTTAENNPHVEALHLLAALIEQDGGTAAPLLRAVNAEPAAILAEVKDQLARLPKVAGATVSPPDMSRPVLSALAPPPSGPASCTMSTSRPSTCWWGSPPTAARRRP